MIKNNNELHDKPKIIDFSHMPRVHQARLPTPLVEAKRLSKALAGPRIFIKQDDLTGAGLGGNKVRKLEYVIGRALEEGADTLVVCGGFQSNLARISAAMGSQLGLDVELVLGGVPGESREPLGNLMLDHLYGATIHFVETDPRWDFGNALNEIERKLKAKGKKPFLVPLGASNTEGMASYIAATQELMAQFEEQNINPNYLYVPIGSGGTYCGLTLGEYNLETPYKVRGISVSRSAAYYKEKLPLDMSIAVNQLGLKYCPSGNELFIDDSYIGDSYGRILPAANEAIALLARTEGIILDPIYTGKCFYGLIEHIRSGLVTKEDTVVFLHTGGLPALFSYEAKEIGITPSKNILIP